MEKFEISKLANLNYRSYQGLSAGYVYAPFTPVHISSTTNNTMANNCITPDRIFELFPPLNRRILGQNSINLADFNKRELKLFFLPIIQSSEIDVEKIEFRLTGGGTDAFIYIRSSSGRVVTAFPTTVTQARTYWKELKSKYGWREH